MFFLCLCERSQSQGIRNFKTVTRTSLCVLSVLIAIIPSHILCKWVCKWVATYLLCNFVTFQKLNSKEPYRSSEREIVSSLLACVLHKREIKHFHVAVVQKRQRNVCDACDARAELLFCLLNLMFRDTVVSLDLKVPTDVVDVNCQN